MTRKCDQLWKVITTKSKDVKTVCRTSHGLRYVTQSPLQIQISHNTIVSQTPGRSKQCIKQQKTERKIKITYREEWNKVGPQKFWPQDVSLRRLDHSTADRDPPCQARQGGGRSQNLSPRKTSTQHTWLGYILEEHLVHQV